MGSEHEVTFNANDKKYKNAFLVLFLREDQTLSPSDCAGVFAITCPGTGGGGQNHPVHEI